LGGGEIKKLQLLMIYLYMVASLFASYLTVILFNWYSSGELSLIPKLFKTVLKIIALSIPFYFIANALSQSVRSSQIDFDEHYQNLPQYLAFFATLISIYLLYRTLISQTKANRISAFENRFFKFIDYHRANVENLKYRDPKSCNERYWEGIQVFTVIYYEIADVLREIEKHNPSLPNREKQAQNINQAFQFVFYGAGERTILILKSQFNMNFYGPLIKKKAAYSFKKVFYLGHVGRLGHYFRNIYQMVKYVESKHFLTPYQKYEYVTHFRAQMSVYEQAVFFFNSFSELGDVWEWKVYNKEVPEQTKKKKEKVVQKEKKELYNKLLITKYDFVRNTLNNLGVIAGVNIKAFYPLINLERSEECSVHGVLPFKGNDKEICRCCFNEKYIGYKNEKLDEEVKDYYKMFPTDINKFKCDETDCRVKRQLSKMKSNQ
jgi:hypothetical protein